MNRLLILFLLASSAFSSSAQTQPDAGKPRVYVAESDSWETKGDSASGFGAVGGILGGGALSRSGGGARPQTAEVIKTLGKRCPDIIVNGRPELGDYILRLEHEGGKALLAHKDKVAVFDNHGGDVIFSASTLSLGGAVQAACGAIASHWAAHRHALTASQDKLTTIPASAPVTSTLQVKANIAGADIEIDGVFAGNAPSTLSVPSGLHTITVRKKGYADWSRSLHVAGTAVRVSAQLEIAP